MKFYYNDKLLRTSKHHHYTHAVIQTYKDGTVVVVGCRTTKENAERLAATERTTLKKRIAYFKTFEGSTDTPQNYWYRSVKESEGITIEVIELEER